MRKPLFLALPLGLALAACSQGSVDNLQNSAADFGNAVDQTSEDFENGAERTGERLGNAGERMSDSLNNVGEAIGNEFD